MKICGTIKKHISPPSIPETEYGMSEASFFIKALEVSPVGSTLYLDQFEPEDWATRLLAWSFRKNIKQFEADYYTISEGFVVEVKSILSETPESLNAIRHVTIVTKDGETFLSSNDNFTLVTISDSLKRKSQLIIGVAEQPNAPDAKGRGFSINVVLLNFFTFA